MNNKLKTVMFFIITYLISFIGLISSWYLSHFGGVSVSGIIFTIKAPAGGIDSQLVNSFIIQVVAMSFLVTMFLMFITLLPKLRIHTGKRHFHVKSSVIVLVGLVGLSSVNVVNAADSIRLSDYIDSQRNKSVIYEEDYVDPATVAIEFPEQKRNLIYINLESMESTFASKDQGGYLDYNLIPNLSKLRNDNLSFSTTELYNGDISTGGTGFTVGSLVAQTSGVPLTIPINGNSYTGYGTFLPGAYSISDVLETQGYNQVFMCGSDGEFGGRSSYFQTHGGVEIDDYYYAIERGWIPEDYRVFWGYEDQKLYEFAKIRLTELAAEDEPFNFNMLTVDTHAPEGYACDLCEDKYDEQYANVISCADHQIDDFLDWLAQQDFYENTTIVIRGDHVSMSKEYLPDVSGYARTTYNVIINSVVDTENVKNRQFSHMDWYPTTLAALGADIEGDRLGLGTNLFSATPTLMEELGGGYVINQVARKSDYYDDMLLDLN